MGLVFSSCSPDFGVEAVVNRFGQIEPKLLFVCDGYSYAGKPIDCRPKNAETVALLTNLQHVVLVPFSDPNASPSQDEVLFTDFCIPASNAVYESLPFDQPLYILYSSGTTGKPKCIVHGAGGTLLQHTKELLLHVDLHPGDRVFYFTTCGWMMWNWLVSALATKATVVLYDGSPFTPHAEALLELAAEEQVNVFGVSPRYLTALEQDSDAVFR